MIKSMTGFGNSEKNVAGIGKINVQLRCTNHKFLETVLHLPEGFLVLEEKLKKSIEAKIKRGRVTCVVNISRPKSGHVFINRLLLSTYLSALKKMKKQFHLKDELSLQTLINLPGILSLEEHSISEARLWPHLAALTNRALADLVQMRQKEGRATQQHLKKRAEAIKANLAAIKSRFKQALKEKLSGLTSDEERSVFLKDTDISEEIERLSFHIQNFKSKLAQSAPVGKELDFIAQEMQREANTLAAKSFGVAIASCVVQLKSQVEKIREQVQNIE